MDFRIREKTAMTSQLKTAVLILGLVGMTSFSPSDVRAQGVGQLANGLLNVQVGIGNINIGDITVLQDLIDIGAIDIDRVINDITLNDVDLVDIDTINVTNVLNNNQIRALSNILNRSPILSNNQDFLNNLLREANVITDNQTVVGILNGVLVIADVL